MAHRQAIRSSREDKPNPPVALVQEPESPQSIDLFGVTAVHDHLHVPAASGLISELVICTRSQPHRVNISTIGRSLKEIAGATESRHVAIRVHSEIRAMSEDA